MSPCRNKRASFTEKGKQVWGSQSRVHFGFKFEMWTHVKGDIREAVGMPTWSSGGLPPPGGCSACVVFKPTGKEMICQGDEGESWKNRCQPRAKACDHPRPRERTRPCQGSGGWLRKCDIPESRTGECLGSKP